ncbi:hypothetical protein HDV02_005923 [Globomyces sp. JEL0801]|nr:hypothetical protein HDV02_005923 [Globomyces sp. JEL0801]
MNLVTFVAFLAFNAIGQDTTTFNLLKYVIENDTNPLTTELPVARPSLALKLQLNKLFLSVANQSFTPYIGEKIQYPKFGRCSLEKDDNSTYTLSNPVLQSFFTGLFRTATTQKPISTALSQFDLFHGHLFYNNEVQTMGIVFHAKEYPKLSDEFPYNLGFCQRNSTLQYNQAVMAKRNLLWLFNPNLKKSGKLLQLDASKKSGILKIDEELPVEPFYTLYEYNLGKLVSDLYLLPSLPLAISPY